MWSLKKACCIVHCFWCYVLYSAIDLIHSWSIPFVIAVGLSFTGCYVGATEICRVSRKTLFATRKLFTCVEHAKNNRDLRPAETILFYKLARGLFALTAKKRKFIKLKKLRQFVIFAYSAIRLICTEVSIGIKPRNYRFAERKIVNIWEVYT